MKKYLLSIFLQCAVCLGAFAQSFSIEEVTLYSFPSELIAADVDNKLAWAMNEQGLRNIYVSKAPEFSYKKITDFSQDDGQEITSLQFTADGNWLVFVRGGEHGSNWQRNQGMNPAHGAKIPKVEIWKAAFDGSGASMLAEGDDPTVSPDGKSIAFLKGGQVWTVMMEGAEPNQLFEIKGNVGEIHWSPDGSQLLFAVNRGTHSLVGIFDLEKKKVRYIAPSFQRDWMLRWSPNGQKIAFVRRPGGKGEPLPILEQRHSPWEIWVADVTTGEGKMRWKAPETLRGSLPSTHGSANLNWADDETLVYLSYEDGWPHMYAMHIEQGRPRQLTQGKYMVEHVSLSKDGSYLVFSANAGPREEDIDRRHIGMVNVHEGEMELLSQGDGIEAIPVVLSDNEHVAYVSSTFSRPLLPTVTHKLTGETKLLAEELIPQNFPMESMIRPRQVTFVTPDLVTVHAQLFEKEGGNEKKPAVLFVHGGPQRQMLLGWHYGDYYSNTYAINQKLAEMGFVVLSVNFRLGIGYGYEFHKPARTYWQGAEEYIDVKKAGEYLAALPQVDSKRIGIYGGSYGGFLTALALGKDSDLFAAGVDIHGVHELSSRLEMPEGYEKAPDFEKALRIAWLSSPLAYLDSWRSPVLFIHGDDDRNVQVSHTTDIIRRFDEKGMPYESLIIPDDSHHWMKYENLVKVNKATVEFLKKHLEP
ncbi:peptidase S9, prolyl oligopeptidase active site domain protein [Indibacter alkaliphilus LW1]|uniref:Acyl-peptide hydrolase n=1 Tax=Indibacter alkaliphilus (strain CCUG 57479 / KCTC 22604 / LW1) TaxID=1189612 RepID=S2D433_INDAL|nr:prolyl oligopeptidase family serine peptidase [Indibacter alkaliphilus]EOZ93669.1 peptidase S9, prolyl oligopeptidase active site domain protein [Indibacter alkaliphilus LW1]